MYDGREAQLGLQEHIRFAGGVDYQVREGSREKLCLPGLVGVEAMHFT